MGKHTDILRKIYVEIIGVVIRVVSNYTGILLSFWSRGEILSRSQTFCGKLKE